MMDLDQALNEVEEGLAGSTESTGTRDSAGNDTAYDIVIKNGQSGAKVTLYVTPDNTLGQVFSATAASLGFNKGKVNNIYVNERTSQSVTDPNVTLKEFKVLENYVVSIEQDGKVAAW